MEARNIFENISPVDHRYSISESSVYNSLIPWISEDASIAACVKAEIALIRAHFTIRGQMTPAIKAELEKCKVDPAKELGLEPSEHSTQLVEPEYLLRLLLELNITFGIIANLTDDLRNLQRSEIGEVREEFDAQQAGSSTMPQKRNPWNSEHIKSLWKTFMPRVTTFFMDQISEHQRDFSNSASQRFIADYIAGFCFAVFRMKKVIEGLRFDEEIYSFFENPQRYSGLAALKAKMLAVKYKRLIGGNNVHG